jgi:cysteine desulfurase
MAMGLGTRRARGSVRFSLSSYNTDEDVDYLLQHLPGIIGKLRSMAPLTADQLKAIQKKANEQEPSLIQSGGLPEMSRG